MIVITNLVYTNLKLRNQYDFYFNSVELVFFNLEYERWSKNISTAILILETQKIALLSFVILKWKYPCTIKTFLMNWSARFKRRNISSSHTFSIMANNWCWEVYCEEKDDRFFPRLIKYILLNVSFWKI